MAHTVFEMLREGFKGFGADLLADIRQSVKDNATAEAEDAARYQWELGVEKSVLLSPNEQEQERCAAIV